MQIVEFLHGHAPYQAGERAGFRPEQARFLERQGVARIVGPTEESSAVPPRPTLVTKPARGVNRKA